VLWRVPPNPLPLPQAASSVSPEQTAALLAFALAAFAVLAAALGWRAPRLLAALSDARANA
jgi:hypothetical protein